MNLDPCFFGRTLSPQTFCLMVMKQHELLCGKEVVFARITSLHEWKPHFSCGFHGQTLLECGVRGLVFHLFCVVCNDFLFIP